MIRSGIRFALIGVVLSGLGACHGAEEEAGPPPVRPVPAWRPSPRPTGC